MRRALVCCGMLFLTGAACPPSASTRSVPAGDSSATPEGAGTATATGEPAGEPSDVGSGGTATAGRPANGMTAEADATGESVDVGSGEAGATVGPADGISDAAGATGEPTDGISHQPAEPVGDDATLRAAADCFPRAVDALGSEPRTGEPLEAFLGRGLTRLRARGPLPRACSVLRPDGPAVPICPGGNRVHVERSEEAPETGTGGGEARRIRYRFDCGGGVTADAEILIPAGEE